MIQVNHDPLLHRFPAAGILNLLFSCLFSSIVVAQGSAGSSARFEPRSIVDMPTAGMLSRGDFAVDMSFYQQGGLLFGMTVGVLDRLSFGVSYGGSRLIGTDSPVMNDIPGVQVKLRILNESVMVPAIALGFDSQGREEYLKGLDRYMVKSPGFYAVVSKNYSFLGFLSLHGGVNYSLERGDGDRDINGYAGVEKTIGPFLSVIAEYNAGLNDSDHQSVGKGRGYLNGSVQIAFGGGITMGVDFKDILANERGFATPRRTIRVEYIGSL